MMTRAKALELGPDCHVVSSHGMMRVPTVGSPGGLLDANAVRTKYYLSQSAKSFLKDFPNIIRPLIWTRHIKQRASVQTK